MEASSKEGALIFLQKNNLIITFLEEASGQPFYAKKIKLLERISKKDIVTFSRQLSLMFKSRISLLEALRALSDQAKNASLKEKISIIAGDVEGGTLFSQALSRFPKIFSAFYVSMVKSGEASGTLSESLNYLADNLEREYELAQKIQGAMLYPSMIIVVVIGVLVIMMLFVIPSLATVLEESDQELPLLTKIVIWLSGFLRSWWWLVMAIFIGIFAYIMRYLKTAAGKKMKDEYVLKIPLIAPFLKMVYVSRFAENLSTLVSGGLPIAKALEITSDIVGNGVYRAIISQIQEEVRKGERISSVLARYPENFPPLLTQMVQVGEKTGTLDQSLSNVVEFYRKEINRSIENLLAILEPALVVVLGIIVGGLMASVLMPMYKMTAV